MIRLIVVLALAAFASGAFTASAGAQDEEEEGRPEWLTPDAGAKVLESQQRLGISAYDWMQGDWRGIATVQTPDGPYSYTQTMRARFRKSATLMVVEGVGHDADGTAVFQSFGVLTYEPVSELYEIESFAAAKRARYPIRFDGLTAIWDVPDGGKAKGKVTFTMWQDDEGQWRETGVRHDRGKEPVTVFDMTLTRLPVPVVPDGSLPPE